MKNNKFKNYDRIINLSWSTMRYQLDKDIIAILVLTGLYENNKISREKLLGQLQSLKKGDLLKFKNTYHCSINDKWYNQEHFDRIFEDLYIYREISYIKLIEVLQLYTGMNYNYCINIIVKRIIEPLLNYFANTTYDYFNQVFDTNLSNFPNIEQKGYKSECWECGSSHWTADKRATLQEISRVIDYFHVYKKGNLTKIPKL